MFNIGTGVTSAIRQGLARAELSAGFVLLSLAVVIGPYFMIDWPGAGRQGTLILLLAGLSLAVLLIGPAGQRLQHATAWVGTRCSLRGIIIAGAIAQVVTALATHPVAVSDGKTYLQLAQMLGELRYVDEDGHLAFWPPGLPLVLAPFVAVFGAGMLATVLANLLFYAVGVVSAWRLAAGMFGARAAVLAALLFTFWPSRLLTAAVVSKENLTIAATLAGAALAMLAFRRADSRWWLMAACAGVAFGVAALAQPGLLLYVVVIPLAFRVFLATPRRFFAVCGIIFVIGCATLLPWHLRNCYVFNGQFCGLATNGGSVFYRANNPLATGEWTAEGQVPITHLPELQQNKLGFALGKQWIRENPLAFAKLAARKLGLLLRDDRYGAYWAILRGQGGTHEESLASASSARNAAYEAAHWVSLIFWLVLVAWVARALLHILASGNLGRAEQALVLIYPLLYSALVFSVFESDRRQHLMALGFLVVLAAGAVSQAGDQRAASGTANV